MSLLRNYLTPQAYAKAKAEKMRRDAKRLKALDMWLDNLTLDQLDEIYFAESTGDLVSLLRRLRCPEEVIPHEWKSGRDFLLVNLRRLPDALLEVIAYGNDPEVRPLTKTWIGSLSEEQRDRLAGADEDEAWHLAREWGYPELAEG